MGLKKNIAYNTILSISGYFCSLITYPYISRVLGVNGIGICDFIDGIINYFILFSMMGISACGIREIASNRKNAKELSKIFSSIITFNALTTVIAILLLIGAMYSIDELFQYRTLLYVGVCKLCINIFIIEWFYAGMENFAYITKRNFLIKILYIICVFVFIKNENDYTKYYILTVSLVAFNALINIIYSRKFVHYSLKNISFQPYLYTIFSIGLYKIITSLYTTLNIIWLGFICNVQEVGFYTASTRLFTIIIAVFTAFTNVMFPRLSLLFSHGLSAEFWEKIDLSIESLMAFSFPTICIAIALGPVLLHCLLSDGFEGSFIPFQIIATLIFIIGFEQILVMQILLPMKYDKVVLKNSIIGAAIALLLNFGIVHQLGAIGTAIVWICSETCVFICSLRFITKHTEYKFPKEHLFRYTIAYIPLLLFLILLKRFTSLGDFILLFFGTVITLLYTLFIQIKYLRYPIALQVLKKITRK